ncbi:MAG: ATP-dependent RNA helicase HrpA, partial [Pseudomonadales bacterium]|nr:ATP-dependent RNA helicase HrpA [Pseudomonadales bacterium]
TQGVIAAIKEIEAHDKARQKLSGDVLVFLPTERDIRDTATALRKQRLADTEVLPLYARLRHSEQVRIFQPHTGRRIVLSTNVAETSLTVPGIIYVIDTGLARISRYSLQNKVQRLPIEAISQASANQRKGRCGRVADGICIRLYSESDYESRPQFTDPEILRTNLASVILRMQFLRLGDVAAFPFLEPPATKAINDGFKLLVELSALNAKRELTTAGKQMARLPVDPKYARMLVTADQERCLTELLIIVSALSIQDPREQGSENRQQALERQQRFNHPDSDFLSLVNLWNQYEEERQKLTQGQLRKFCKQHHLAYLRMREWRELHRQLLLACQQLGFKLNKESASYGAVHKAIITGSLNQIAVRHEAKTYQGSRNKKFKLLSSSVLSTKQAKWIVTGDQIETSQTFASMAAKIQPEWVEEKALHLVKREYFDPHWSKKQQAVFAYEKVSLYGLVIVEKKPVPFAPIDSSAAHSLFIREGLANNEVNLDGKPGHFLRANAEFLQNLAKQEEKIRKPEHFVSESDIANFYASRIPTDISSTSALRSWLKESKPADRVNLEMDMESLFGGEASLFADPSHVQYPDQAPVNQNRLTIDYLFEPGHARDGATVEIPLEILPQIAQADIDWAVPGIIAEKCTALIKALPKSLRKNFIPVSGFVNEITPQMLPGEMDFLSALIAQIRRVKKLDLAKSVFTDTELPEHLRIKIRVVNEEGEELAFGEDIHTLKQELASQLDDDSTGSSATNNQLHDLEVAGLKDWSIQSLPSTIEIGEELVLLRYPALVDESDSVSVKLFSEKLQADTAHRQGLIRLYKFRTSQQRRMLEKQFTQFFSKHALKLPADSSALTDQAVLACYRAAFEVESAVVRDKQAFDDQLNLGKQALFQRSGELESLLLKLLDSRLAVRQSLEGLKGKALDYVITDVSTQLEAMFGSGFLVDTPWIWLKQYPRYLDGVLKRLEKAPHLGPKDRQFTDELGLYWRRYRELCDRRHTELEEEIDSFRWMIEEYRVSLFAQSLGTRMPVSAKRLEKALAALQQ